MKKLLLSLLFLTAMALPWATQAQVSCEVTVVMFDSYGDGWNGNAIQLYQNGTLLGTATITDGAQATASFVANTSDSISLRYVEGYYSDEASFMVLSGSHDTLLALTQCEDLLDGTDFATVMNTCPSCIAPMNFAVDSATSDAVYLSWSGSGTFQVAHVPHGTALGDEPNVDVTYDTTYAIYDLAGDTLYDFYVRTDCADEYSYWAGPISYTVGMYIFGTSGSDTISTCGTLLLDNGGFNPFNTGSFTLVVRPTDDTATVHLTGSFDLGSYGTMTIFDGEGTSGYRWGYYSYDETIDITSMTGSLTLQFVTSSYIYGSWNGFELIANCLRRNDCLAPFNSSVSNIGPASAKIEWTYAGNDLAEREFEINVYDTAANTQAANFSAYATNSFQVYGLNPSTGYMATISAICDNSTSDADTVYFTTTCIRGGEHESSQGVDDITAGPFNTYYKYGYTQSLYLSNETGTGIGDTIYGISYYNKTNHTDSRNVAIYMTNTDQNNYTSESNSVAVAPSDMVYHGMVQLASGWTDITLQTPFVNDGRNIAITILDSTGSFTSTTQWRATIMGDRCIYMQSDNNMPSLAFNNPELAAARPDCRFSSPCVNEGCAAPNLNVTYIGSDTVTITWAPGLNESSWYLELKAEGDTDWTFVANTSNMYYEFTGLSSNTTYTFRVTTPCGSDNDPSSVINVTTACTGVSSFPFTEGFENFIASNSLGSPTENCWNRLTNSTYTNYPYAQSSTYSTVSHTGNIAMYFYSYSYGTGTYSCLVLPRMGVNLDTLTIQYYAAGSGTAAALQLGVMSDPNDISTFRMLDQISTSQTEYEYTLYEYNFSNFTGDERYIAFYAPTNVGYNEVFLDDINVFMRTACGTPDALHADTATATTIDLAWNSLASDFEVRYGAVPFDDATASSVVVSGYTATITGLNPGTNYHFQVRALCNDDTSNWSLPCIAATACSTLTLPYTEDFEAYSTSETVPLCWTSLDTTFNDFGWITTFGPSIASYQAHNSTRSLLIEGSNGGFGAVTPELPVNANQTILRLSYLNADWTFNGTNCGIIIGVTDNPADLSTFVPVDTIFGDYMQWNESEISFESYTGTGRYISFISYDEYTTMYLDDIQITMLPTCPRARNLAQVSATSNSATVAWTASANQSNWQIEYGPRGFEAGQGTYVNANSNPFTITGLTANTQYDFNVRAICSASDTAEWALANGKITTRQIAATIPYAYDFEDATEWNNWAALSTYGHNWFRGTATAGQGSYSIYISDDNGTSFNYHNTLNAVAYRDVDFGSGDSSAYITFKAICGGIDNMYFSAATENLYLVIEDADLAVACPNNTNLAPWGELGNLNSIFSLRLDTTWTEYQIAFPPLSGVHRVVFYFNSNTYNEWYPNLGPASVDDIHIRYMSCNRPTSLNLVSATSTSATVAWTGSSAQYLVHLQGNGISLDTVVTTTTLTFTNLTGGARYNWNVTGICTGNDTSMTSETASIFVPCFDGAITTFPYLEDFENSIDCWEQEYVSGNASWTIAAQTSEYDNPHNAYSGYSFALLEKDGRGNTTRLISPTLALNPGSPATLTFAHAQIDWSGDLDTLHVLYRTSPDAEWTLLAAYGDEIADWTVDTLVLPNVTDTYQIAFEGYAEYGYGVLIDSVVINGMAGGCVAPVPTVSATTFESATIDWAGNASSYEVAIALHGQAFEPAVSTTANTYTFSGLYENTQYDVQVRQICDENEYSPWGIVTFTTDSLPCFAPANVQTSAATVNSITISWTDNAHSNAQAWVVNIFNATTNIMDTVSTNPATISGLYDNTQYSVAVKARCATLVFSDWSDTITFTTATCSVVSNVSVSNITTSGATVTWTAGASETAWEVNYGRSGFGEGQGTIAAVTTTTYQITGLEEDEDYDVYVRAKCAEGIYSDWSPVRSFTTLKSDENGIDGVDGSYSLSIYPNPASSNTTISLRGIEGEVTVTVVDMNGRTISSDVMNCGADCVKTMTVDGLAQGTYFVRVLGDGINSVRKLIVR